MNGPEILTAEVIAGLLALAAAFVLTIARGWVVFSLSVRVIPPGKREAAPTSAEVPAPVQEIAARRDAA